MEALDLHFVGPSLPDGGVPPINWPKELPEDSKTTPTYRTKRKKPETATRQRDFVFVSSDLVDRVRVVARNKPEERGPSDHCSLLIELK